MNSMFTRAVCATVELAISNFNAMTNDLASTVCTLGCHGVDRTFKAIERAALALHDDRKRLIIFISADITLRHLSSFLLLETNLCTLLVSPKANGVARFLTRAKKACYL
jgi:hypothetical protein